MTYNAHRFSVAPMMDWTDRHCRAFHRRLSRCATLYTEMVTVDAVIYGERAKLLGFSGVEEPLVLQLGGSDPPKMRRAAEIAAAHGYRALNLNVGCPSDRVQSGRFGACLMREPALVAALVEALQEGAPTAEISVKCRIGVDDQDPNDALFGLVDACAAVGCQIFIVHARKAWLQGLSPKENREIPPLDYGLVHRLKAERPNLAIMLNGGLESAHGAKAEQRALDGVMLGRAAYRTPAILLDVDPLFYGRPAPSPDAVTAVEAHMPYIEQGLAAGTPLHAMTRHMLGLFHSRPGGRVWRRILTEEGPRAGAGIDTVRRALDAVIGFKSLGLQAAE